jgi:hypothetical protein
VIAADFCNDLSVDGEGVLMRSERKQDATVCERLEKRNRRHQSLASVNA